jgi:DNA mismatch repair protein MutS
LGNAFLETAVEGGEEAAVASNGILLYGVNAAGKSSLGKAIGLAVLLAQTGCPVPASSMTLIPYNGLFTRILGNDNLWAGMSSFVVEMTEFRSILRSAGRRTLVLGDELCAGTETASATSIVAAGVKTLVERGAHFFFATHLHELAEIPDIANNPALGFYHLSVRPSPTQHGVLLYDRKIRKGTGSPMYGLEVCRGLDMDSAFLTAAFAFRRAYFAEDGSRLSAYNADVVVAECQVCGNTASASLETHHIVPQAMAVSGRLPDGRHKNEASNLVPLCSTCHDAHHRGLLEIKGWIGTSFGRKLEFTWKNTAKVLTTQ